MVSAMEMTDVRWYLNQDPYRNITKQLKRSVLKNEEKYSNNFTVFNNAILFRLPERYKGAGFPF